MWILDSLKLKKDSTVPAVITREKTITFKDVWEMSESIAADIESLGKKTPVVIYGDKNPNMIPTMMAALKTGRAYVPVDVSYPIERLNIIAHEVDACVIYNYSGIDISLPFTIREESFVSDVLYKAERNSDIPESHYVKDDDDCYILFTSGSTGKPKGVPITKANIMNFIDYDLMMHNDCGQNVLCQTSFSFDVSGHSLYIYMNAGKTLICVDKVLMANMENLMDYMAQNRISVWISTPSFVDMCRKHSEFNAQKLPDLEAFFLGGETLTKGTAKYLREAFPNGVIYNVYGPTEATIWISGCVVTDEMIDSELSIPIGVMCPESIGQIVTDNEQQSSVDNPGELLVVSKSVARGYFNNPEKTKESFFKAEDGRMGYRTGDLVYEKDGLLYFVSRKDFQLKLSGYRIELDDIVNNLIKIPFILSCAVLPAYDEDGKVDYLAAFVVLKEDHPEKNKLKNIIEIKKQLRMLVPSYMVPQKVIILTEFPLNVNGKTDRKELAKML